MPNVGECLLDSQVVDTVVVSAVVRPQVLGLVCQDNARNEACIGQHKAQVHNDKEDASAQVVVDLVFLDFVPEWQDGVEDEQPW